MLGVYDLLWLAPAEWLLELPLGETGAIETALAHRLPSLAVITDLSDALISFDISGAGAAEIILTGCSLDLHPASFPSGRVARTRLAGVPAILRRAEDAHRFRCFVDRGFATHLLAWLQGSPPQ